jgi:hypothetical protein
MIDFLLDGDQLFYDIVTIQEKAIIHELIIQGGGSFTHTVRYYPGKAGGMAGRIISYTILHFQGMSEWRSAGTDDKFPY